jgi:predicted GIY-YIG superfamily endonuclease
MKHYVYILMNEYGAVEYVGYTKNPKQRMKDHIKHKPYGLQTGKGLFYGRTDLTLEVVKQFNTRGEAEAYEGELKLQFGFVWNERIRTLKGSKNGAVISAEIKRIPISVYDKDTGDYIATYNSQKDCCNSLNLTRSSVSQCITGKLKSTGGYIFKREQK